MWVAIVVSGLLAPPALARDRTAELRSRFDRETDVIRKAKLMPKLGAAQLKDAERDVAAGRISEALKIVKEYRAEAEACLAGLDARKINAVKHSAGFKQLQISVREALRRLNNLMANLTADEQARFVDARNDLNRMNQHLLRELFPTPAPRGNASKEARHRK